MKNNIYAIGNALVDFEVEVNESFLNDLKIDKGLMTLIDESRREELLKNLEGHDSKMSCGGSAANTIIGATQLGAKSFYSCKVSNDNYGTFYAKDLKGNGVHSNLESSNYEGITGKCLVFVTPDADRTMNTYLGITATFSKDELVFDELIDSNWLYIEGYLVTGETGLEAAMMARSFAQKNDVKTSLTLSDPGIVAHFKNQFLKIIGEEKIDLLFCNSDEAMSFTSTSNVEEASEALKKFTKSFAMTCGKDGALVFNGDLNESYKVSSPVVNAVDTNGAGDLFAGSFIYAIENGHNFKDAAEFACACSAKLVTKFGARLSFEEINEVKSVYLK